MHKETTNTAIILLSINTIKADEIVSKNSLHIYNKIFGASEIHTKHLSITNRETNNFKGRTCMKKGKQQENNQQNKTKQKA